jgi:hypothetical protein
MTNHASCELVNDYNPCRRYHDCHHTHYGSERDSQKVPRLATAITHQLFTVLNRILKMSQ